MQSVRVRRGVGLGLGWAGAVAAAATFGVATISALDDGSGSNRPLSQQEVRDLLATAPSPALLASPAPTMTSTNRQFFTTSGGSLWVSCSGSLATIDSITPRQGFRLHDYDHGPDDDAEVRFRQDVQHGHATEYEVTVTCVNGVAAVTEAYDD